MDMAFVADGYVRYEEEVAEATGGLQPPFRLIWQISRTTRG